LRAEVVLACGLGWSVTAPEGALGQTQPDVTNGKIEFAYFPPKTVKYQATMERLKSRHAS